jgi:hypothetical protein
MEPEAAGAIATAIEEAAETIRTLYREIEGLEGQNHPVVLALDALQVSDTIAELMTITIDLGGDFTLQHTGMTPEDLETIIEMLERERGELFELGTIDE